MHGRILLNPYESMHGTYLFLHKHYCLPVRSFFETAGLILTGLLLADS